MQTCILDTVGNERQISLVYMRDIYIYMNTYMSIYIYTYSWGKTAGTHNPVTLQKIHHNRSKNQQ